LRSTDNHVLLIAQEEIQLDYLHIYEIPIPDVFSHTPGIRRITVTLAFDPPVRHRRAEYVGNSMRFDLIRGEPLEDILKVYKAPKGEETKSKFTRDSAKSPFDIKKEERSNGTVQRGTWTIQQSRSLTEYPEPFYLVVLNDREWQQGAELTQHYAVVVSLEHENVSIDLYTALKARTQVRVRERAR